MGWRLYGQKCVELGCWVSKSLPKANSDFSIREEIIKTSAKPIINVECTLLYVVLYHDRHLIIPSLRMSAVSDMHHYYFRQAWLRCYGYGHLVTCTSFADDHVASALGMSEQYVSGRSYTSFMTQVLECPDPEFAVKQAVNLQLPSETDILFCEPSTAWLDEFILIVVKCSIVGISAWNERWGLTTPGLLEEVADVGNATTLSIPVLCTSTRPSILDASRIALPSTVTTCCSM